MKKEKLILKDINLRIYGGGGGGGGGGTVSSCLTETTVVPAMRSKNFWRLSELDVMMPSIQSSNKSGP
jgi:hypothetical protein